MFWVLCLFLYCMFRIARVYLPIGPLKASIPSLLFIPVTLPLVDMLMLLSGDDCKWSERTGVVLFSTIVGCLVAEGISPMFVQTSTGDWRDVVAIVLGGLLYYVSLNIPKIIASHK